MRALWILCLCIMLLFVGCVAGPFESQSTQSRPTEIVVNNTANETHTFEVWVVDPPANVTLRRSDGKTGRYEIEEGVTSYDPGGNRTFSVVSLPESARLHGRFTLEPGEANESQIEALPRDHVVVVFTYRAENEIIEWVDAHCGDAYLKYLQVQSRHIKETADVVVSFNCGY